MDLPAHGGEIPIPITSTYSGSHIMDLSAHGGEIPIPITSTCSGSHIMHEPPQNNIIPSAPISRNGSNIEDTLPYNKVVRYRECLKNHAAAMGGNATDGCGEFMPSGAEGTLDALKCSACNCHRNFHRKDTEGGSSSCECYNYRGSKMVGGRGLLVAGSEAYGCGYPTKSLIPRPEMIMSYNLGVPSESDEQEGGGMARIPIVKKRIRTKFTQEQKEKMLSFAEKVGWRMQKQEEGVVQQICQEIGIERRVLKVWMHNNKHNLAKKSSS